MDLITPFNKAVFLVISFIDTENLKTYLDSPVPYIIGASRAQWDQISSKKMQELPEEAVVFDLKTQTFKYKQHLPTYPTVLN